MKKQKPDPLDYAGLRQVIIDLLSRRDYSRLELFRKLSPRAADVAELDQLLDEMAERQWQSDERFTDAFLHGRRHRYGPVRLTHELRRKGISGEQAQAALAQQEVDWQEQAISILQRKFAATDLTDVRQRARAYRFLAQRGFASGHIQKAIDTLSGGTLSD